MAPSFSALRGKHQGHPARALPSPTKQALVRLPGTTGPPPDGRSPLRSLHSRRAPESSVAFSATSFRPLRSESSSTHLCHAGVYLLQALFADFLEAVASFRNLAP